MKRIFRDHNQRFNRFLLPTVCNKIFSVAVYLDFIYLLAANGKNG